MRQCPCSHKGMDVGISYLVIHFCVCKKFFQVLYLMSNVHHLVVPLENLLPHHLHCLGILGCCLDLDHHLNSWSILECCLDPGHGTSVKVQDEGLEYVCLLVYSPVLIPRQLRFPLYSRAVITEGLM